MSAVKVLECTYVKGLTLFLGNNLKPIILVSLCLIYYLENFYYVN